ncbi:outer membrane beta-barrel protein [Winogradskyella endarachnes]|nr:outer membrane beta-barrel protein [Winogradskyella endarachnes]
MFRISLCFLFLTVNIQAQNINLSESITDNDTIVGYTNQRSMTYSFNLLHPGITNSSAIGSASEDKLGFNIGAQIFLYKHFYLGAYTGTLYLDVKDKALVGNYERSTVTHSYLQLGYEFPISQKIRLDLNFVPWGDSRYKNILELSNNAKQIDRASITMFGAGFSYSFSKSLDVFVSYSYRSDESRIQTASQIQGDFNTINYNTLGIGIRFFGGKKDLFTEFKSYF